VANSHPFILRDSPQRLGYADFLGRGVNSITCPRLSEETQRAPLRKSFGMWNSIIFAIAIARLPSNVNRI
jgi:hypothetical protein